MPTRRRTRSWQQNLNDARAKAPEPRKFRCENSGEWVVIPSIAELEEIVRAVPCGKVVTVDRITERLRQRHAVDMACPLTTGIFLWILAHAADDRARSGGVAPLPWWRVLKKGGELNPKYPGGGETQRALLESEGHRVTAKGKKLVVVGYESAIAFS